MSSVPSANGQYQVEQDGGTVDRLGINSWQFHGWIWRGFLVACACSLPSFAIGDPAGLGTRGILALVGLLFLESCAVVFEAIVYAFALKLNIFRAFVMSLAANVFSFFGVPIVTMIVISEPQLLADAVLVLVGTAFEACIVFLITLYFRTKSGSNTLIAHPRKVVTVAVLVNVISIATVLALTNVYVEKRGFVKVDPPDEQYEQLDGAQNTPSTTSDQSTENR